eukprot:5320547-Pyramimonas_sp.AAC.1
MGTHNTRSLGRRCADPAAVPPARGCAGSAPEEPEGRGTSQEQVRRADPFEAFSPHPLTVVVVVVVV